MIKQKQTQKKKKARTVINRKNIKRAGGYIGSTLGGYFGQPGSQIGNLVGRAAGGVISKIAGYGDYTLSRNSILHPTHSDQLPSFIGKGGGTRIRHREYIGDVLSSVLFNNNAYTINPANATLFPWLSTMAGLFEQWRPHGMVFEFKSLYSDAVVSAATTASLGTTIMATEYNALASRFVNKIQMENTQFVTSAKPSLTYMHGIECSRNETSVDLLYVRLDSAAPGDARLYDLGTFQFATQGLQTDGETIGELWVTYDIELFKPVLTPDLSNAFLTHVIMQQVQAGMTAGNGLMGETNTIGTNSLGVTLESPGVIALPAGSAGYYQALLRWAGSGSSSGGDFSIVFKNFVNCKIVASPDPLPFSNASGNGNASVFSGFAPLTLSSVTANNTVGVIHVLDNLIPAKFEVSAGTAAGWPNDVSFGDFYLTYLGTTMPS